MIPTLPPTLLYLITLHGYSDAGMCWSSNPLPNSPNNVRYGVCRDPIAQRGPPPSIITDEDRCGTRRIYHPAQQEVPDSESSDDGCINAFGIQYLHELSEQVKALVLSYAAVVVNDKLLAFKCMEATYGAGGFWDTDLERRPDQPPVPEWYIRCSSDKFAVTASMPFVPDAWKALFLGPHYSGWAEIPVVMKGMCLTDEERRRLLIRRQDGQCLDAASITIANNVHNNQLTFNPLGQNTLTTIVGRTTDARGNPVTVTNLRVEYHDDGQTDANRPQRVNQDHDYCACSEAGPSDGPAPLCGCPKAHNSPTVFYTGLSIDPSQYSVCADNYSRYDVILSLIIFFSLAVTGGQLLGGKPGINP